MTTTGMSGFSFEYQTLCEPCMRPGTGQDWWREQHTSCTGSETRDGSQWRCLCSCHSQVRVEYQPDSRFVVVGPGGVSGVFPTAPKAGQWQLRFTGDLSFQCLGTFNGPVPRIGEKVCYLRNDGIHTAEVKDVVYSVYPSGITDVMVYIEPPTEPGADLHP